MGRKILAVVMAVAVLASLNPIRTESAESCNWMCYGGGETGANSVPDVCAPIGETLYKSWSKILPSPILSQPAVDGDRMYFGTFKNVFYCIDSNTGDIKWEQTIGGSVYSTPCIDDENVYICSWDRKAYCFDKFTGKRKWAFGTELYIFNSPMVKDGWLFIGSRDEKLYCLNPKTGGRIWEIKVGPVTSTPIIYENRVYIAEHEGTVYCIDPIKKEIAWEAKFPGIIESSLTINKGRLYAGVTMESQSFFYCIDTAEGKVQWKVQSNPGIWSDPCVAGNKVYVSNENHMYAFRESSGEMIWSDYLEAGTYSQAAYCKGKIYFGTSKSGFFVKNADTGETLMKFPEKSSVRAPSVSQKKVFFGCEDGTIYCYSGDEERLASMTITPSEITIPVFGRYQFAASGKMNSGAAVIELKPQWSVVDPKVGAIDQNGEFTGLKVGETKVVAKLGQVSAEAVVFVKDYIRVTPNPIVFQNVPPGTFVRLDLNIENLIGREMPYKFIPDCRQELFAEPAEGSIDVRSSRVTINANTAGMKPGDTIKCSLRLDYESTYMNIPVTIIISGDPVACLKFEPYMLDFGYISRGSSKTLDFKIHYSGIPTKGTIRPLQSWIEIEPSEFDSAKPEQIFKVTITASALPTGDSFGGSMRFAMDESVCNQASMNVLIKTDKGIVLKLAIDDRSASINGKNVTLDVPAKLIAGRTMVPIRFISESFGCKVNWDKAAKEITILRHQMKFQLWLGKNFALVNGKQQPLDAPPIVVDGRTLVPLRFISEPFGAKVEWNQKTRQITVVWDPS